MCLVSLEDPGLTVFGYHRLLGGFTGTDRPEVLAQAIREHFEVEEVDEARIDPAGETGVGVFGYIDSHLRRSFRLRLKDTDLIDELLAECSEGYRRLDAAILEELILKRALGMTAEDVEAKRGLGYAKSVRRGPRQDRRRRRLPGGVPAAPHAGRAGPRGRGGRRDDAPEVHLLLPQGPHRHRVQSVCAR